AEIFKDAIVSKVPEIKDISLSYMDDLIKTDIGNYLTNIEKINIRRVYLKDLTSKDKRIVESAMLNVGNLINEYDDLEPIFYRTELLKAFQIFQYEKGKKHDMTERNILIAMWYWPPSFMKMVPWAITVAARDGVDSQIWRAAIKFLARTNIPPAIDEINRQIRQETDPYKKAFLEDALKFKGVIPLSLDSSEIKLEMILKERERAQQVKDKLGKKEEKQ
ncbi:MAG: hypothetical protein HQK84_11565, partial [Nitrospinae bacterium]|nr:hypothetical protein [Nitrospinota bacterium]